MASVNDPMNPVHFVPNALIPTELDKSKVNYGLAQGIADGPSTENLGIVHTMPNPSATFPSGTPVNVPAVPPVTVFKTSPPGDPTKVPNIQGSVPNPTTLFKTSPPNSSKQVPNVVNQNLSKNVGPLVPPPPRSISTSFAPLTQASGAMNLGGFLYVPEAGAKPENPA